MLLYWQPAPGFCDLRMGSIKHLFVPEHVVCSEKEVEELCKKFGITVQKLPHILSSDPALADLEVQPGQVIKIKRISSVTGKEEPYYRMVVDES